MKVLVAIVAVFMISTGCTKAPSVRGIVLKKDIVESTVATISSGTVYAQNQAGLSFGVIGRTAKIHTQLGVSVKKGVLLAELENKDLKIIFENAVKEIARSKELFDEGLVSRVAYDEAKRSKEVAESNLDKTSIRAPFDGLVSELNLEIGETPSQNSTKPAIRLIDEKPRIVKGDVDEVDLGKIQMGQAARVRIPAMQNGVFQAKIVKVVPFVDTTKEQDRTSQIEIQLEEHKNLIPVGASAEIEIITGRKEGVLAVPTRALLGSGEKHIFKIVEGKLVKTLVKPGMGNYERTEILEGLSEGNTVAWPSDDLVLKDGMKVKPEIIAWP